MSGCRWIGRWRSSLETGEPSRRPVGDYHIDVPDTAAGGTRWAFLWPSMRGCGKHSIEDAVRAPEGFIRRPCAARSSNLSHG